MILDYDIEIPLTLKPNQLNQTEIFANMIDYENINSIYGESMDLSLAGLLLATMRQQLQSAWIGKVAEGRI